MNNLSLPCCAAVIKVATPSMDATLSAPVAVAAVDEQIVIWPQNFPSAAVLAKQVWPRLTHTRHGSRRHGH